MSTVFRSIFLSTEQVITVLITLNNGVTMLLQLITFSESFFRYSYIFYISSFVYFDYE